MKEFVLSRVGTVMENLEKSWNFKMIISRIGKVLEKKKYLEFFKEKSCKCCYLHMLIYTV